MMAKNRNESERMRQIREKANEQRRAELARERRRRGFIQTAIIVAVLVVVGGGGLALYNANRASAVLTVPDASGTITVAGAQVPFDIDGSRVRVGAEGAPVTVGLIEDYSCPHCAEYEAEIGSTVEELVADGSIAFEMTPVQIVTHYGVRAGSAATCVAVGDPDAWFDVHRGLFERHDATSDGWRNADLREFVQGLGVDDRDTLDCIADGTYESWIETNTADAAEAGITSTPTLLIDGEQTTRLTVEQLRARVAELAGSE
jgi:protein-disulfide isomerase